MLLPIKKEVNYYEITLSYQVLVLTYDVFEPYLFVLEYKNMIPDDGYQLKGNDRIVWSL
jgi:hypothetical protein